MVGGRVSPKWEAKQGQSGRLREAKVGGRGGRPREVVVDEVCQFKRISNETKARITLQTLLNLQLKTTCIQFSY